jgi:hypothetical protein
MIIILPLLCWLTFDAYGSIVVEDEPRVGVSTWISVASDERAVAGETVSVVHRPGIAGEQEIAVGITDASGRVRWSPKRPGVTIIQAGPRRLTTQVSASFPPPEAITLLGLIIMAGLSSLLYGLRLRRG